MTEQEIAIKFTAHEHEIGSLKHRVKNCEDQQKDITTLIRSVDKLANNMENMLREQQAQGERLNRLEDTPREDFKYYKRLIIGYLITGVLSAVLGAVVTLIFK